MSNYHNHTATGRVAKYEPLAFEDGDGTSSIPSSIPPTLRNKNNRARRCCSATFSNNLRPLIWLSVLANVLMAGWMAWFSYQQLHRLPWKGVKPLYSVFRFFTFNESAYMFLIIIWALLPCHLRSC